jgi:hypothetical protein
VIAEDPGEQPLKSKKSSKKASKSKSASPEPAPLASPAAANTVPFDVASRDDGDPQDASDRRRISSSRGASRKSVRLSVAGSSQLAVGALAAGDSDGSEVHARSLPVHS